MTAVPRPCQVLAEGPLSERGTDRPLASRANPLESGSGPASRPRSESEPFEQTTHVTLTISSDSATKQPGLYLRYRESFPSAEAARRYHDRVQDWLATRPDPRDEAPAPVIVDQPRSLHEILEFWRDDEKFARPVVEARPFDQERE